MFIPLTAKNLAEYTPPSLEHLEPKPYLLIRVPTMLEREQVGARLTSLGLSPVTEVIMRATMIDALWDVFSANDAEENAQFLDGYWQRQMVHETVLALWQEQETQRLEDEMAGAPSREPYVMPKGIVSIRETARANLLFEEMMAKSQRLRDLAASRMDYQRRTNMLLVRMHVADSCNLSPNLDGSSRMDNLIVQNGLLGEATAEWLHERLHGQAWNELNQHIDSLYELSGQEEKNSVSPLGKPSGPSGSPAPIVALVPSDGSSMTLSTSAPLTGASEETTAPLSSATSELANLTEIFSPTDEA
jgi:hypothetical protein